MSIFEIGNYVIIDDVYMGKIIKKIWNGYGVIVKLDNNTNYIDDTILQYHLINDVTDNSDIKGFMLVKSDNKMRLVNKHNLANMIKNELNMEKFMQIEQKIKYNYSYFTNEILPTINTNLITNVPVVPIKIKSTTENLELSNQDVLVGGNLEINDQLEKINSYVQKNNLNEYISYSNDIYENNKQNINDNDLEKSYNLKRLNSINIIGGVYNPYLNNVADNVSKNEPKLINVTNGQKGASKHRSMEEVHKILGITDTSNITNQNANLQDINVMPMMNSSTLTLPQVTSSGIAPINANQENISKMPEPNSEKDSEENESFNEDKLIKYREQDKMEDNYELYIRNMIKNLFKSEYEVDYEEYFSDGKVSAGLAENLNLMADGEKNEKIKPTIKSVLEKFKKINKSLYLDLTNTLLYKHIIADNKLDNVSFGKELILRIKECLLNIQKKIKFEDNRPTSEIINLFEYIKFKIMGGYIVIEDHNKENLNLRIITPELVPNLNLLKDQYENPINYQILSNIILENKTTMDLQKNKDIILEALNILAQEYFICLQPRVEYLLWTLTRLILCWYSDPVLNENIVKIKILINLYRARGIKDFNKEIGVQPVIMIVPRYGRESALKILSNLSYYFFPYKNVGWKGSSPSYFNKVDNLIYYTNGSIDLKRYIKHLLKTGNKIISPISNDFTKIKLSNESNDIEYNLPK